MRSEALARDSAAHRPDPPSHSLDHRIASLDQFRGYTVAGMFLVNFVGAFAATPLLLQASQHVLQLRRHDHAAVLLRGRLCLSAHVRPPGADRGAGRRPMATSSAACWGWRWWRWWSISARPPAPAPGRSWSTWAPGRPCAMPLEGTWFQTLMHIAVTSLWILPVIRAGVAGAGRAT